METVGNKQARETRPTVFTVGLPKYTSVNNLFIQSKANSHLMNLKMALIY